MEWTGWETRLFGSLGEVCRNGSLGSLVILVGSHSSELRIDHRLSC